jgi:hypothetical protein
MELKRAGRGTSRRDNNKVMMSIYKANGATGDFNWNLPARLDAKQTAHILGFQEHDIPVLVNHGQLEPLGKPPTSNCIKYFARVQIMEVSDDRSWLSKATKTLYQYWQGKNANRKSNDEKNESSHSE